MISLLLLKINHCRFYQFVMKEEKKQQDDLESQPRSETKLYLCLHMTQTNAEGQHKQLAVPNICKVGLITKATSRTAVSGLAKA